VKPAKKFRLLVFTAGVFVPLRWFLWLYYRAAGLASAWAARFTHGAAALFIHRGWTRGDWSPSASDLDLFLALDERRPGAAKKWAARYSGLKKIFPMLGEWLSASGPELDFYLRFGDLRAPEFCATAKKLCGDANASPRYEISPDKLSLDIWNECYHAHARLCGLFFSPGESDALARYGAKKSLLDIQRYSACSAQSLVPAGRFETERKLPPDSSLKKLLSALDISSEGEPLLEPLLYSAATLEARATEFLANQTPRKSLKPSALIRASEHECQANDKFCAELSKLLGPQFLGAITDTLFESYFVFKLDDKEQAAHTLAAFKNIALRHPALDGSKIILGDNSMRLLSLSLKPEDFAACGCAETNSDTAVGVSGSGELAQHRRAYFLNALDGGWNMPAAEPLRKEAFARMLASWRYDAYQGAAGEQRGQRLLFYWLPKAAHFYLFYAKQLEISCYPAEPLLEELARALPETGPALKRILESGDSASGEYACAELVQSLNEKTLAALK